MLNLTCKKGFTLVEMSIVLVILGVILTTVIKGGEVLRSSRIKGLIQTQNDLQHATMAYRERFGRFGSYSSITISKLKNADMITSSPTDPFDTLVDRNFGCNITLVKYDFSLSNNAKVNVPAVRYDNVPFDVAQAMKLSIDGFNAADACKGSMQSVYKELSAGVFECDSFLNINNAAKTFTVYVALYPVAP